MSRFFRRRLKRKKQLEVQPFPVCSDYKFAGSVKVKYFPELEGHGMMMADAMLERMFGPHKLLKRDDGHWRLVCKDGRIFDSALNKNLLHPDKRGYELLSDLVIEASYWYAETLERLNSSN